MRAHRPSYTVEFKTEAVALLRRTDRSIPQVAKDLGVSYWSLREWYRKAEMTKKTMNPSPNAPLRSSVEDVGSMARLIVCLQVNQHVSGCIQRSSKRLECGDVSLENLENHK